MVTAGNYIFLFYFILFYFILFYFHLTTWNGGLYVHYIRGPLLERGPLRKHGGLLKSPLSSDMGGGSGYAALLAHAEGVLYGMELGSVTLKINTQHTLL